MAAARAEEEQAARRRGEEAQAEAARRAAAMEQAERMAREEAARCGWRTVQGRYLAMILLVYCGTHKQQGDVFAACRRG